MPNTAFRGKTDICSQPLATVLDRGKLPVNPVDSVLFGLRNWYFRKAGVKGSNPFFGFDGNTQAPHVRAGLRECSACSHRGPYAGTHRPQYRSGALNDGCMKNPRSAAGVLGVWLKVNFLESFIADGAGQARLRCQVPEDPSTPAPARWTSARTIRWRRRRRPTPRRRLPRPCRCRPG